MANFEKYKVVRDELENLRCFIGECNFGIVINIEEQQLVEGADHVPPDNDMFIQDEGNLHQQHQNVAEGYLEHVALLGDAQPQPDDAPVYPNMDTGLLAGKFIRDLLAVRKLTQMDIQEVMKGTETLVKAFIKQTLSDATDLMLRETGCDHSDVLYTLDPAQLDLFAGLKNQYSRIKFFKEKFNLIMPVKVELPAR
ncbi:uncharacterized protein LOC116933394 isoform X2 [Daphnia magna]|uniref:uncharacterized protein LOC116933394 isoform X2 n=1 Tax=Daphnia magna TaxID=35525 RepID=UPI001E1BA92E|nr:uncharacterized protein LOC116933394 isoform X2 [Daphnia magna]